MTSVAAAAPASTMAPAAAAFNVVMVRTAASACSAVALPRLMAVAISPVPIGFVRNSRSPGAAVELRTRRSASANPNATMP